MSTFLSIIGLVALILFFKFIYDSYLTNNTNDAWEKCTKEFPHETIVIENNNGLNFKTDYPIRIDGIYTGPYKLLKDGKTFDLNLLIVFNISKMAYVTVYEGEIMTQSDVKEVLDSVERITESNVECERYKYDKGKFLVEFNSSGKVVEYSGSILKDGLLLSRKVSYIDYEENEFKEVTSYENVKLNFIKAI